MASSGTKAQWAGPSLGLGPRRRRWAWAEEQDADGRSDQGWGNKQSLPEATSPELLEDFRRAQGHLPALEWDPDIQDSEESSGEGEVDSFLLTVVTCFPKSPQSRLGTL